MGKPFGEWDETPHELDTESKRFLSVQSEEAVRFRIKRFVSICLCLLVMWGGCSQYKRPPLIIRVPDYYDHKVKFQHLSIVADPYFEKSRMSYIFNTDFLKEGFLAVHMIFFNFGTEEYDLKKANFVLVRDDGAEIPPMNPEDVAKKVLHHTSLRMMGWGVAGLIILSVPFALGAGLDSHRANRQTREAVTKETFEVNEIGPKEVVDGFFFFRLGKGGREIRKALRRQYQLHVSNLVDVQSSKSYDFSIGLN